MLDNATMHTRNHRAHRSPLQARCTRGRQQRARFKSCSRRHFIQLASLPPRSTQESHTLATRLDSLARDTRIRISAVKLKLCSGRSSRQRLRMGALIPGVPDSPCLSPSVRPPPPSGTPLQPPFPSQQSGLISLNKTA